MKNSADIRHTVSAAAIRSDCAGFAPAWPCWGDPEFTFCDVERAIQQEIRKRNYLARYELRTAEAARSREMETLKRLEAKYRTVASHQPDVDSAPTIPQAAAQEVARTRMPVQASLF